MNMKTIKYALQPRPLSLWLGPIETAVLASLLAFSSQLLVSLLIYDEVRRINRG